MQTKLLHANSTRLFVVTLETGEEVVQALLDFACTHDVEAAHLTAIGALEHALLGFYDPATKEYDEIPVEEQVEALSVTGNLAVYEGAPKLHAHAVLGRRDGSTVGGHLIEARVRPTLEVMVTQAPSRMARAMDEATRLTLLDLDD